MAADPVTAIATLLSQVFGFIVDPEGYEQLARENKLKLIQRGINDAISKNDWAACDRLFVQLRELRQETGP